MMVPSGRDDPLLPPRLPAPRLRPLQCRLDCKITSVIIIILVLGFGGLTLLMITRERALLMQQGRQNADLITASVARSIQNIMVQGRGDIAGQLVEDLKAIPDLERVQIFRLDGRQAFRDLETMRVVASHLQQDPASYAILRDLEEGIRHSRARPNPEGAPIDLARLRLAVQAQRDVSYREQLNGREVITYLKPMANEDRCQWCHGADHQIRGVVAISTSLEGMNAEIRRSTREMLGIAFGIIVLVALALTTILRRIVVKPIGETVSGIREIAAGNLDKVVKTRASNDEIGDLVESLNGMARCLRASQEILLRSEKLSSLGRLASGVAHEINNPLASVAGYSEDLLDRIKGLERVEGEGLALLRSHLQMIHQQAYRCRDITRNLLDFARKEEFRLSEVLLPALLDQTVRLVEYQARLQQKAITVTYAPDLPPITTDAAQLQQVFLNILNNALDAIEGKGEVRVGARTEGDQVVVEVADTGCGIPPEHLDKIFDPFFTTKPPGKGTGLGLAISYRIVESLGGEIRVQSQVGAGSTFWILLPRQPRVPLGPEPA
ncbi:MAG: HAMP domain-containing protein [Deltaproteobacteria bacterium]|nr:HAMP domain-containing protein [Deltaproteobacteria bacterium]MBI3077527.1 HAMP domain-containing protein [Deltaproteobacteria bacterium]